MSEEQSPSVDAQAPVVKGRVIEAGIASEAAAASVSTVPAEEGEVQEVKWEAVMRISNYVDDQGHQAQLREIVAGETPENFHPWVGFNSVQAAMDGKVVAQKQYIFPIEGAVTAAAAFDSWQAFSTRYGVQAQADLRAEVQEQVEAQRVPTILGADNQPMRGARPPLEVAPQG